MSRGPKHYISLAVCLSSVAARVYNKIPEDFLGTPGFNSTFDYVVVGGGTAGLAIAARLSENPSTTVAVIEAGGNYESDNGNRSIVPGYAPFFSGTDPEDTNRQIDWDFVTVPQAGAGFRSMHYACGKTLGGSSARNLMFYQRPSAGSLQQWATEVGDPSYNFNQFMPCYQKSVNYTRSTVQFTNSTNAQDLGVFDASGGPLRVSDAAYNDPFASWAQQALVAVGQPLINGFQSGELLGTGYVPFTIDPENVYRSSAETSFLVSASKAVLKVLRRCMARKILFDQSNTARHVLATFGNLNFTVTARKEIIVSAGAFQSPQLLMVSGVGPRAVLEALNIPVVKDLPGVGQNLQDQPFFGTTHRVDFATASAALNDPDVSQQAVDAYLDDYTGPLSIPAPGVLGFEKLPEPLRSTLSASTRSDLDTNFPADWPELEILPISAVTGYARNFSTEDPADGHNYATIATCLVAPLSRGNITINSPNMKDPPQINPNWLTHPTDVELAIAALKRSRQIWAELHNITIGSEYLPGPKVQSDADILAFIRKAVAPIWNAAGTCKMGKASDEMAVVDNQMRVFGTQNLRVVDASVMPLLPPGHPQATVYALAEKLADIIIGRNTAEE